MATISMTFTHPQFTQTRTYTFSDANVLRALAALKTKMAREGIQTVTNSAVFDQYFWDVISSLRAITMAEEKIAATKTATDDIGLIV